MRSIGMLATSCLGPMPRGVPKLTQADDPRDPGDSTTEVGWETLSMKNDRIETEYIMWGRKEVFVQSPPDSS